MTIGERINYYRKLKNLSQEDLANALNVSIQNVSSWDTDQTVPSIDNLVSMSKLFDISMDKLCGKEETAEKPIEDASHKNAIAHCLTTYDRNTYENIHYIFLGKAFIINWLIIILSFIIFVFSLGYEETDLYMVVSLMVIIFLLSGLIRSKRFMKKQTDTLLIADKNKKVEYWFYNDSMEFVSTTDNSTAKYCKKYNEITSVFERPDFIYFLYDNKVAAIDKRKMEGKTEEVYLKLKQNSFKYNYQNWGLNKSNLSDKSIRFLGNILLILFILSLSSIFIALMLVALASRLSDFPNDQTLMIENMWLFYCVIPIPLASLILGIYSKGKGIRCKKNIISGIIFAIILSMFGSFTFIFAGKFSHDFSYVNRIEDIIHIELPDNGVISTEHFVESTDAMGISLIDSSNVKYNDYFEVKSFEENLRKNQLWVTSVHDLQPGSYNLFYYSLTHDYDYFMLFNCNTNEFNGAPQKGTNEMFYLAYKVDEDILVIVHYTKQID